MEVPKWNKLIDCETARLCANAYNETKDISDATVIIDLESVAREIMDKIYDKSCYGNYEFNDKVTYYMSGGEAMPYKDAEKELVELFKEKGYDLEINIDEL